MRALPLALLLIVALEAAASATRAQEVGAQAPVAPSPAISWRVVDRFRLFLSAPAPNGPVAVDPTALAPADALLARIAQVAPWGPDEWKSDYERTFTELTGFLGQPQPFAGAAGALPYKATHWQGSRVNPRQRAFDADYLYPDNYVVGFQLTGLPAADSATCAWTFTVDGADRTLSAPCDREVRAPVKAAKDRPGSVRFTARVAVTAPTGPTAPVQPVADTVADRLIVSIGDSYASGEGNPDEPAVYSDLDDPKHPPYWNKYSANRWWLDRQNLTRVKPAKWFDPWCHRSLYSQHFVASAVYAARHPHEAVTFATFACSGAHVVQGIVAVQAKPPGTPEFKTPPGQVAQLQDVADLLCRNNVDTKAAAVDIRAIVTAQLPALADRDPYQKAEASVADATPTVFTACRGGVQPRPVDALLLSIGGNDVGFAGVVLNGLLDIKPKSPFGQAAYKIVTDALQPEAPEAANARIRKTLTPDYRMADNAFGASFARKPLVVQSQYPSPVFDETGKPCDGAVRSQLFSIVAGLFPDEDVDPAHRWPVVITAETSEKARNLVLDPLNQRIVANTEFGWKPNAGFQPMFARHGWCATADSAKIDFDFRFPAYANDMWSPGPGAWKPYARTPRWFRASNDTALTQVSNTSVGLGVPILDRVLDFIRRTPEFEAQLHFAELGPITAIAGTFHPNFSAHVAVGVGAAEVLETNLAPPGG